jgi:hypothetical protein
MENYDIDDPAVRVSSFERRGWRIEAGYFIRPRRYQVIARYAEIERLRNPTVAAALDSGLGVASVWNPAAGSFGQAVEKAIREVTAGFSIYLSGSHAHKLFFDVSRLTREFARVDEPGYFTPADQEDSRFRTMVQFFF